MSAHQYTATVRWTRGADEAFNDRRYSRDPHAVDPEEAFIASVSSCHMLFFLDYAAQAKYVVDRYEDIAIGTMGKNEAGREYVATIVLAPKIQFSSTPPTAEQLAALHHRAHEDCFIANSIRTEVRIAG
jgi:organic hydroperoxide reductase OsmC/OhrA